MSIDEAIRTFVASAGLDISSRVYSHKAPQPATPPYCVFYRISPEPVRSQSGAGTLMQRTFQFSVFSPSQSTALSTGDALRAALDGYSGTMGGLSVKSVMWQTDRMDYDDVTKLFGFSADYRFQYYE